MSPGYFRTMYELCTDPIDGDVNYFIFGFLIVMSPIGLPLFYIGKGGEVMLE